MNPMKYILLILTLISCIKAFSAPFPADYVGLWKGDCQAGKNSFKLQIDIKPTTNKQRYTWIMKYSGASAGDVTRDYAIEIDAKNPSTVWFDEGVGAKFQQKAEGNTVFGLLVNQTVMLHSKTSLEAGVMTFELHNYSSTVKEIQPQVGSFAPFGSQNCSLKKN